MRGWGMSAYQLDLLLSRSCDTFCADRGNLWPLLLQAPLIAACMVIVWRDVQQATDTLYFVLGLSALWLGTLNACREIVKERPIVVRELALGLEPTTYVLSKFAILALLALLQALVLVVGVDAFIPLEGSLLGHFLTLWLAALAGTALGLAISTATSTSDRAVALAPILLIPQILFSQVVLDASDPSPLTVHLRQLTISEWAYVAALELGENTPDRGAIAYDWAILILMTLALLALSIYLVRAWRQSVAISAQA